MESGDMFAADALRQYMDEATAGTGSQRGPVPGWSRLWLNGEPESTRTVGDREPGA
jgi:hypothetical protein